MRYTSNGITFPASALQLSRTSGLAQKTTGLLRQTSPETFWTPGTSLLISLLFMGTDPF